MRFGLMPLVVNCHMYKGVRKQELKKQSKGKEGRTEGKGKKKRKRENKARTDGKIGGGMVA